MSIVVLKRKTNAKYNNMSVGQAQFSLNGGYRNQGWVGQTSLSRHYPKTPMKGSGGCCGKYNNVPVVLSAVTSTENNKIMKTSSIGTPGMISTQYRWIRRPQPYAVVKPDSNNNNNDGGTYIENLRKKTITEADSCFKTTTVKNNTTCINGICGKCNNSNLRINKRLYNISKPIVNSFARDKSGKMAGFIGGGTPLVQSNVTDTQSLYLLKLNNSCVNNDVIQHNTITHAPYPGFSKLR